LKTFQIALIVWIKAGPSKSHFCFDQVNRLNKYVWGEQKYLKYNKINSNSENFRGGKFATKGCEAPYPPVVAGLAKSVVIK